MFTGIFQMGSSDGKKVKYDRYFRFHCAVWHCDRGVRSYHHVERRRKLLRNVQKRHFSSRHKRRERSAESVNARNCDHWLWMRGPGLVKNAAISIVLRHTRLHSTRVLCHRSFGSGKKYSLEFGLPTLHPAAWRSALQIQRRYSGEKSSHRK